MHHTEARRARNYKAMREAEGPKIVSTEPREASSETKPDGGKVPSEAPTTPALAEGPLPGADPADPDMRMDEPSSPTVRHDGPDSSHAAAPVAPPEPMPAEDGVDMEYTSFLMPDSEPMQDSGDAEMSSALMDALQVLGVSPLLASRFACAIFDEG